MSSCIFDFTFEEPHVGEQTLQDPWYARLLSDSTLRPVQTPGRQFDHDSNCTLMTKTLHTPETIPACQSFFKDPTHVPTEEGLPPLGEFHTFYKVGSGLDGHDGVCHGGILSALIDHAMGSFARVYPGGNNTYTRYLHVDFRKPFVVPGAILCRTWMTKIEGRKLWVTGRLEDEKGNPYISAEALFLKGGPKL